MFDNLTLRALVDGDGVTPPGCSGWVYGLGKTGNNPEIWRVSDAVHVARFWSAVYDKDFDRWLAISNGEQWDAGVVVETFLLRGADVSEIDTSPQHVAEIADEIDACFDCGGFDGDCLCCEEPVDEFDDRDDEARWYDRFASSIFVSIAVSGNGGLGYRLC